MLTAAKVGPQSTWPYWPVKLRRPVWIVRLLSSLMNVSESRRSFQMKKNWTSATVRIAFETIGSATRKNVLVDARAVERRRLENLARDGAEVARHQEDRQRQPERRVGDDQRPERVDQMQVEVDREQRQQHHLQRDQDPGEEDEQDDVAAAPPHHLEPERRGEAQRDHQHQRREGREHAVLEVGLDVAGRPRFRSSCASRGRAGATRSGSSENSLALLERLEDQPDERIDLDDQQQRERDPSSARECAPARRRPRGRRRATAGTPSRGGRRCSTSVMPSTSLRAKPKIDERDSRQIIESAVAIALA